MDFVNMLVFFYRWVRYCEKYFDVKTYSKFRVENIFLQTLVNKILNCVVEEVSDDTKKQVFLVWLNVDSTGIPIYSYNTLLSGFYFL